VLKELFTDVVRRIAAAPTRVLRDIQCFPRLAARDISNFR
jgi:hypothetical protein